MKKYLSGLLTGIIITLTITTFATTAIKEAYFNNEIKIVDQDVGQLQTEIVTVIKDGETSGRNYVSVADLSQALGKTVTWDGETKTINLADVNQTPTPTPTPSNTSSIKKTTYKGYEAIEQNGTLFVVANASSYIYGISLTFENPNITLTKDKNTVTFSKFDTNYCIVNNNRVYIKLSVFEGIAGE